MDVLLEAAACLAGSTKLPDHTRAPGVTDVLLKRIHAAHNALGDEDSWSLTPSLAAEQNTASYALYILERVQTLLDADSGESGKSSPPLCFVK